MKALLEFNSRHPVATTLVGSLSGLGGWLAKSLHVLAGVIADLGLIAGGCTAMLVFILKLRAMLEERRQRQFSRRWLRRDPHDDDSDYIP